jgi:polyisoprenoid-binding protein YceI
MHRAGALQSLVAPKTKMANRLPSPLNPTIMKRLPVLIAVLALAASVRAEVEIYKIDPVHSSAGFSIRHMFSKFSSSFTKVNGTITVDRDNMEKNSVEATIDVTALNTDNEKRNDDLKSEKFFDIAKFPTMTFKSTSWKKTGEDTYDVTGDLTIKDVTKEVVLNVKALGFGPGRPGSFLSGWEATTMLKKSDYHMEGPAGLAKVLGDDVSIDIVVEAGYKKA